MSRGIPASKPEKKAGQHDLDVAVATQPRTRMDDGKQQRADSIEASQVGNCDACATGIQAKANLELRKSKERPKDRWWEHRFAASYESLIPKFPPDCSHYASSTFPWNRKVGTGSLSLRKSETKSRRVRKSDPRGIRAEIRRASPAQAESICRRDFHGLRLQPGHSGLRPYNLYGNPRDTGMEAIASPSTHV